MSMPARHLPARPSIPFDTARLDRLMEAAGIDALIATSKHNVQYLLGAPRANFFDYMDALGVSRLQALGAQFDPQQHEAVSLAPADDPSHAGRVVAVLREGYAIGDDVLRPASVVVGTAHG